MIEPDRVTEIIRTVARTEIMPRFRNLQKHQIREKSPNNLVTEADVEAEKALAERLVALLPGSQVVGEEGVAADPSLLDALTGDAPVWVLDPVDGTANFAHGRAAFGVIVALVQSGRTMAGWIHDPIGDVTATVVAGTGAWIGSRRLAAAGPVPLAAMSGSLGYRRSKPLASKVERLVRQGAVAHDYMQLAAGELHFAYYRKLTPWDHAAGVLMFQEAGGFAQLIDGSPYRPQPSQIGVLLAPDEKLWKELRSYIED